MPVLGIITCEILELEIAHILRKDSAVSRVTVLESSCSRRLIETLCQGGRLQVQRIPHLSSLRPEPSENMGALVRVLELGLHRKKEILRKRLAACAREMERYIQGLMLGYGICGGALTFPETVLDIDVPVFIPMDNDRPVDDCVSLCLGGRDQYSAEQRKTPGTYYLTPGWSLHWQEMFDQGDNTLAPNFEKRLFRGYERLLLLHSPIVSRQEMRHRAESFRNRVKLILEEREGTLRLLETCWNEAKLGIMKSCRYNT